MDRTAFYASVRRRTSGIFGTSLSQGQVTGCEAILNEAERQGTPLRFLAYMLATSYHETGATMKPITEYGQRSYFDKYDAGTKIGAALGNTQKGDGYKYRGRGFVQLTGRSNYARAAKELAVDLVRYPDDALEPDIAAAILFRGMTEGWFTGKKLSDYINLDKTDYFNARRIVNGTDRAQKIAGYAKAFEAALREGAYASQAPKPKPVPVPPAPSLTDAQKTAGVPFPQKAPESAPASPTGGKTVAAGVALILAGVAGFWAYMLDGWHHLISFINGVF
jgi:predicted chitinase